MVVRVHLGTPSKTSRFSEYPELSGYNFYFKVNILMNEELNLEIYMKEALKEAKKAYKKEEVPVRCGYCKKRSNYCKRT